MIRAPSRISNISSSLKVPSVLLYIHDFISMEMDFCTVLFQSQIFCAKLCTKPLSNVENTKK